MDILVYVVCISTYIRSIKYICRQQPLKETLSIELGAWHWLKVQCSIPTIVSGEGEREGLVNW